MTTDDALDSSIQDFFEGIIFDNRAELLPITKTLEEFGEQTNERYAGDRSSVEHWIVRRLEACCYTRAAQVRKERAKESSS